MELCVLLEILSLPWEESLTEDGTHKQLMNKCIEENKLDYIF